MTSNENQNMIYFDVNNLYGFAMSNVLLTSIFK